MRISNSVRMLRAADGTSSAGAPTQDGKTQADSHAPTSTGDASGTNSGSESKQTDKPAAKSFATEADFQAEVDRILKERLERAETKAQERARKAAEDAEAQAAAKNGEWQALADKRGVMLAELEAEKTILAEQVDAQKATLARYEKALTAHVAAQSQNVPDGVRALLKKLDPVEQLDWLAANSESISQQQRQGVPATPSAATSMDAAQQDSARKSFGRLYNNF